MKITAADLVRGCGAGEEIGSIPEDIRDTRDISKGDFDILLGPSQLGRETLVLCFHIC